MIRSVYHFLTTPLGLGTLMRFIFHPFAWTIDKIWTTDLMRCERCTVREYYFNEKVPEVRPYIAILSIIVILIAI